MNHLLLAESARFRSRTAVRASCAAVILLIVAAGALTFAFSNRDFAGATERARESATRDHQACLRGEFAHEGATRVEDCRPPVLAEITADPRFHLGALRVIVLGATGPLVMLALVLGASFVGGEWHHRTMTTLLTWESRRGRVAIAKLGAAAGLVAIGVLAVHVLLSGALLPAAIFRGTTAGVSASWLGGVIAAALRSAALAALAATLGGAVALLARNTAFAVGIWLGWLAALEGIVRGLKPAWSPWLLGDNIEAFVSTQGIRSPLGAGVLLSVYAAAITWFAIASFRRRDLA